MSLSTTSTAAYTLTKYSRAYPSQTSRLEADVEWQHFTNPVMQLVLDIKKKASGEPESYRVRVLWFLNQGIAADAMEIDRHEVVFEDVDLLSFSPSTSQNSQIHSFSAHGIPLKAVYRDVVVGFRYMHPRVISNDSTPSYRRFQINFQKTSDATNFIDAIRHVCPCKANGPPGLSARSMTMATTSNNGSSSITNSQLPDAPSSIPAKRMHSAMTMQPSMNAPQRTATRPFHLASGPIAHLNTHTQLDGIPDASVSSTAGSHNKLTYARQVSEPSQFCLEGERNKAIAPPVASLLGPGVPSFSNFAHPSLASDDGIPFFDGGERVSTAMSYSSSSGLVPDNPTTLQTHSEPAPLMMPSTITRQPVVPNTCSTVVSASQLHSATQYPVALPIGSSTMPPPYPHPALSLTASTSNLAQNADSYRSAHQSRIQPDEQQAPAFPPDLGHTSTIPASLSMDGDNLIDALRKESSLYKLPRQELELLVGSVLREEGFIDFLKTLDKMWQVKGFVKSVV
ncbi:hypothetical protein BDY19DRAFT_923038, partial [Irpex rosettiformis]